MEYAELAAWLRLCLTPGVGNIQARKLLGAFGLPEQVFTQSAMALTQIVTPAQAQALLSQPEDLDAHTRVTLDWLHGPTAPNVSRHIFPLGNALYPHSLLAVDDPPLLLYATGCHSTYMGLASKQIANDIAIVGTRNPTPQGTADARNFAKSFAQAGLHVVSGLALGIDGAAHQGVLDAWDEAGSATRDLGSTIAVVGTGLDRVYPKKHYELAHRICEQGVMLSEFMIGTPPIASNFPKRNRIIAALSQGTLVVEAAYPSGSLITARMAIDQGKDVFAIPGSIHSTLSKGCHHLIKQGAKLVESAHDVLDELTIPIAQKNKASRALHPPSKRNLYTSVPADLETTDEPLDGKFTSLLDALGYSPVSLDALISRTGIDAATLQAHLMELELQDQVARLPGGMFQRHTVV